MTRIVVLLNNKNEFPSSVMLSRENPEILIKKISCKNVQNTFSKQCASPDSELRKKLLRASSWIRDPGSPRWNPV